MIQLIKLAYRDLGRNRRRSFLSALALGIGLALLLLMAAVIEGEMGGALKTAIELDTGHLEVRSQTYQEGRASLAWQDLIENPDQLASKIAALEPVLVATPRLLANGIVSMRTESAGVRIVGVVAQSDANRPLRDGLLEGDFIEDDDREGIVIGRPLAEKLDLGAGSRVNLLANTSNGDVDEQPFIVRGVYTTGTPAFDENTVLMPLAKAQTITRTEDHASSIFVLLDDQDQVDAVAAALTGTGLEVVTWEEANELLMEWERMADSYMVLLYVIVLAITATVIVNTLVMAVFERMREIGILSALGMTSRRITMLFLAESIMLALGGVVLGLVIGGALVGYATEFGIRIGDIGMTGIMLGETIYAQLNLSDIVVLSITALLVTIVASLYPAWLASRLEPVDALRAGQ